jgi:deoxyribose-phosphate aldolase
MQLTYDDFAGMIDHSLLNPTFAVEQLEKGIDIALAYRTASVCIMPWYLKRCAERLAGSTVRPSTVIGFPHGGHVTSIKVKEAEQALRDGGIELDMVVNISAVLSGKWELVATEIRAITDLTHAAGGKVKVIFENCYLNEAQKIRLCELCAEAKADWVKTSTGYGTGGAVDDDLRLMRKHSPASVQVKAAGGVRTYARLLEVRTIGVSRVGATATQVILDEARALLGLPPVSVAAGPVAAGY